MIETRMRSGQLSGWSWCVVSAAVLLLPTAAIADPVTISSGHLIASPLVVTELRLEGTGFSITASDFTQSYATGDCDPCFAGGSLDLSRSFGDDGFAPDLGRGTATYLGTVYSDVYFDGNLQFSSGQVLLHGEGDVVSTSPFTMSGFIRAYFDPARTMLAFSTDVRGGGLATVTARFSPPNEYTGDTYAYQFDDVTVTPEPTTLLLVASGLLGALARRRQTAPPR